MGFELTADDAVDELTSKETFNVFDFVRGATLPTATAVVYTDADAALKLAKIFVAEAARAKKYEEEGFGLADEDTAGASEEEITELHERLVESALKFNMQGFTPSDIDKLEKELKAKYDYKTGTENEEYVDAFNHTLIARSIVSVERNNGAINTDKWTAKMVAGLLAELYVSESNKLFETAAELSYVGAIFDRAVSADFS